MTGAKRVHFISIGGTIMSNLAIALHHKGLHISGSDDEVYDPSKANLEANGLLPRKMGWDDRNISSDIDAVIVGMHAKEDNPELLKAKELKIKIYSFPEYIHEQSLNKQRIVIAGSHGKTTITSMILHVLHYWKKDFDYVVGASLPGIDNQVKISNAPVIIIEGDEYLTSPIDRTPKFLKYKHHIALITGIEWDHMNVYPDFETYTKQFEILADNTPKAGLLIHCAEDNLASIICTKDRFDVTPIEYTTHPHKINDQKSVLITNQGDVEVSIFGTHNMQNLAGAQQVLKKLGISDKQFYEAIPSFKGAWKRLQLVRSNKNASVYLDYAHSPSKVKATTKALKELKSNYDTIACFELHTFSSLNKEFLKQYAEKFKYVDKLFVYFDKHAMEVKKMPVLSKEYIRESIGHKNMIVHDEITILKEELLKEEWLKKNLIMMSSGNFNGLSIETLADEILQLAV